LVDECGDARNGGSSGLVKGANRRGKYEGGRLKLKAARFLIELHISKYRGANQVLRVWRRPTRPDYLRAAEVDYEPSKFRGIADRHI